MQDLHISATLPSPVVACKQKFKVAYPKYGSGTVELSPYGDYDLSTHGITDGSARRTQEYKDAYNKVTEDMLHAYEAENKRYTCIHREMDNVLSMNDFQQELMNLAPQKYERASFRLPKPTQSQVEEDLRHEMVSIHFDQIARGGSYDQSLVKNNLNVLAETRQNAWQEACDLFNQIEDAKEDRANARYLAEYQALFRQKKAFIEGEEEAVTKHMRELAANIQIPYNLTLSWNYNKTSQLMSVSLIMEDGISIPTSKASMLASGKISVKNKPAKELIWDKTHSAISFLYYVSSKLYGVSPNIHYLRISLYDRDRQSPLLWVEFDRTKFSQIRPGTIDVVTDILGYPLVLDLKEKGRPLELVVMTVTAFEQGIERFVR